jgi:hypothetical protein
MIWAEIVLSVAFIFVRREWIIDTYTKDPVSFVIWTILWIVAGVSIGRMTSNGKREHAPNYFERRRMEREEREREERERAEREERDRRIRRNWVMGLDSNMKSFLYEIAEYDSIEVPLNDGHIKELRSRLSLMGECAIECTNVGARDGDKYWRVSLSDLGKQVVAECSNILKEARDFESR